MAIKVFPKNFRQVAARPGSRFGDTLNQNQSYPSICFAHLSRERTYENFIYLPMPPGVEINDSMSYGTLELGQMGDIASKAIKAASGGQSAADSAARGFAEIMKQGGSRLSRLNPLSSDFNAAAAASIALKKIPMIGDKPSKIIDFTARQLIAPNTNTTFNGSEIRSFGFKFKMVADSEDESRLIYDIVKIFRENSYPGGDDFIQEYPGSWVVSFLDGDKVNGWVPQMYESYLKSFSSSYNAGSNMWHFDGSPLEVDIALQFQEVKALNRATIKALNDGDYLNASEKRDFVSNSFRSYSGQGPQQ